MSNFRWLLIEVLKLAGAMAAVGATTAAIAAFVAGNADRGGPQI